MGPVLNPETWLKDLKGPPWAVLSALLFYGHDGRALNPTDLARYTGYGRPAVYEALIDLGKRGLCQNHGSEYAPAWLATQYVRQFVLPMGDKALPKPSVSSDYTRSNVVVEYDPSYLVVDPTTTYEQSVSSHYTPLSLPEPAPNHEVLARLRELGVWPARAIKAARDPWVTVRRIDGWVIEIRKGHVRNLASVLMAHLDAHEDPPDIIAQANAAVTCPKCWMLPCRCDDLEREPAAGRGGEEE